MKAKAGASLYTAVALIVLAFVLDTGTTFAAGRHVWSLDLNPLVRGLGAAGYLGFSVVRLACALAILLWRYHELQRRSEA